MIGSTLLTRHVITAKKQWGEISLTNKILLWISIVDIIASFFVFFMSSWMVPRGTDGVEFAAGTTATCMAQGFFDVFSIVYFATAYTELAVLYWLILHWGWTTNKMEQRRVRFSFLLPPIFVSLCFAVPPLFFDMYNPMIHNCTLIACQNDQCAHVSKNTIVQAVLYCYVLLGNIIVVVFMGLLIFAVHRQEKKFDRYLAKGQGKNRKNTSKTAWQGVRFSAAFVVTYLMYYVIFGFFIAGTKVSDSGRLVITYWLVIVTPMLGAFNSCVYFYPRYATHRKQNPKKTCMSCLCEVLGINIDLCHSREKPETETSEASTPLIKEEEVI